jgi:hypothetical protein
MIYGDEVYLNGNNLYSHSYTQNDDIDAPSGMARFGVYFRKACIVVIYLDFQYLKLLAFEVPVRFYH